MIGIKSSISAIACHPYKTLLALAGAEGFVIIYDYVQKGDPKFHQYEQYTKDTREKKVEQAGAGDKSKGKKGEEDPAAAKREEKEKSQRNKIFTTLEFTPQGDELLVGQSNGTIQIIDPETGKYKELS